ncbi:hypothetical protein U0070_020777 [Myodes glareolus]|uniref:Uncharacterized protein n=1 Tax=Myodes glareolus TaxID=447135 RepID=A0AAW0IDY9_MYOGA
MKTPCISRWLLGMALLLCSVHTRSLRRCLSSVDMDLIGLSICDIKKDLQTKDTFKNITILSSLKNLDSIKPVDVCCVTSHLLTFYRDTVFKDHLETSNEDMEKISKLSNSFLQMQRTLEQCVSQCVRESVHLRVHSQCNCSQEATNAIRIIQDNYNQVRAEESTGRTENEMLKRVQCVSLLSRPNHLLFPPVFMEGPSEPMPAKML